MALSLSLSVSKTHRLGESWKGLGAICHHVENGEAYTENAVFIGLNSKMNSDCWNCH